MRIGIDGRYAEGNLTGIGQYIEQLVKGLSGQGHSLVIFYSKPPLKPFIAKNISTVILPSKNRYQFEQVLLPKALIKHKVVLYHAPGNLGIPFFCPCKAILTVHDIIPLLYPNYFGFSKIPFVSKASYYWRTASSINKAKKVLTDSEFTKKSLIKKFGVSPNKVIVVPLGIKAIIGKGELSYGLTKGKYILNNGGIDVRKNLFKQIEAFAKISPDFPEFKLVITGENQFLRPRLQDFAKELGIEEKVVFPGYVDEEMLWFLIKNSACLCLPTEIEGFGFPVLTGFVSGVPVVASNSSSIPEIAGEAAILVNPKNTEEISSALKKVLSDKKLSDELVKKGLEQVKKFTWEKTIVKTVDIYRQILK